MPKEDEDDFSVLLYRSPGDQPGSGSKTYGTVQAKSPAEVEKLAKEGWSKTLPEAYKRAEEEKAKGK